MELLNMTSIGNAVAQLVRSAAAQAAEQVHAAAVGHHVASALHVHHVGWLWLIPLFPIIGATINATIGWKLQRMFGKKIVHRIAVTAMLLAFGTALVAFKQLLSLPAEERFLQNTLWNLLTAGRLT